jgi:pyruvate/2-oxoglutarate dehydrogenase complex dihydrolipoamide dehydrogenase (E3) component
MYKQEYDLFVIGTGMSGVTTAMKAAKKKLKVGITDYRPYGGTCALRGCDPKNPLIDWVPAKTLQSMMYSYPSWASDLSYMV